MINKNTLQSFISKYYLNGLFSQVKWRVKDNTLTVYAGEQGRAGKAHLKNFQFEDCELGIFDTHKLAKLLSITSGDVMLATEKINKIYTKLNIADSNFDLNYSLADIFVIPKATYYKDMENPDIEIDLSKEDIEALIKAKTALSDQSNLLVKTTENLDGILVCEFTFGDIENFSNKVTYTLEGKISTSGIELPFNSDILKDMFSVNKDMDGGKMKILADGMIQLNFYSEDIESEYFLLRNE